MRQSASSGLPQVSTIEPTPTPSIPSSLNEAADALTSILRREGIPLEKVEIDSLLPNSLKITLRSDSSNEYPQPVDSLAISSARRATAYLRRTYAGLDSYSIEVRNAKNDKIQFFTIFFTLGDLDSKPFITSESKLSNEETASLAKRQFGVASATLESVTVITDPCGYGNTQQMTIVLAVPDTSFINTVFPTVVGSTQSLVEELNINQGTTIAVTRVIILDSAKKPLVVYVRDGELQSESYTLAPDAGIEPLNQPAPTESPISTKQP
jgi:hypothetical protein